MIAELLRQDARVIMAGSGRAGRLLQKSFPDLKYYECPAYKVNYQGRDLYLSMLGQLPKIFRAVYLEHRWLRRIVAKEQVDAVISDSRFGCYHAAVPSVLITHQLNLQLQPAFLSHTVNWFYQNWLKRFRTIWIPDQPDGLSGALSYPTPFQSSVYIGLLSRFSSGSAAPKRDLLVLLSGPEPQRSRLEAIVLRQLETIPELKVLIVQGKTDEETAHQLGERMELVSYLAGAALEEAIRTSAVVLCRSGYSSLMDLATMHKPAILIPTPGQPEQEYLAQRCREKNWAVVRTQSQLDIREALQAIRQQSIGFGTAQTTGPAILPAIVKDLLQSTS